MAEYLDARPLDYQLIERTRAFLIATLSGNVNDQTLIADWQRFHQRYDTLIRRFAASCGVVGEELEDVVQNVWAIVIRDLPKFDCDPSRGSFASWLFSRVRNTSVNKLRDAHRRRELLSEFDFDNQRSRESEPPELFEQQWNEVVLHNALDVLEGYVNELDYKLFVMRHFHEMSIQELSEDSNICESTVRSKLHRTMKQFVTIVKRHGYAEMLFQ